MRDKIDQLFGDLQSRGFAKDKTNQEFRDYMLAPGEQGYQNRKQFFEDFKSQGMTDLETYEDFAALMGLHAGTPERRNIPQPQQPANDEFQQTINNANQTIAQSRQAERRIGNRQQRIGLDLPQGDFGRVNLGQNRKVTKGQQRLNPETGELEDTYVTPQGNEYENREMADVEQNVVDQQEWNRNNPKEALGYSIDGQIAKLEEEIRKQESLEGIPTGFGTTLYQSGLGVPYTPNSQQRSYDDMRMALRDLQEAKTMLERNKQLHASSDFLGGVGIPFTKDWYNNWKNFGYGVWDALHDVSLYDFGVSELGKAGAYMRIKNKIDNGEELTDQETDIALAGMALSQAQQLADLPHGYTAGVTTTEMAPFMAQMAANPASGMGKAFARKAVRKFGRDGIGAITARVAARVAGNIGEAAVLSNTWQAGKTAADIMRRNNGEQFAYDEDGNVIIGHYEKDEDGNDVFVEGGKDLGQSIFEGEAASIIENFTELGFGGSINGMLSKAAGSKLGKKLGLGYISDLVSKVGTTPFARSMKNFMERTHWDGMIEEPLEEEYGIILNSLLTGDNKISDLWDSKQQADIFAGTMWFGGMMAAMNTAAYPFAKRAMRRNLNNADVQGEMAFGDEWPTMKATIDNMDDKDIAGFLYGIKDDGNFNNEQKAAMFGYAARLKQYQGANTADMLMRMEGNLTNEESAIKSAYDNGSDIETPDEMKSAVDEAEAAGQNLTQYGPEFTAMVANGSVDPTATLNYMMNNRDTYSDEEIAAAADYYQKHARAQGVMDSAMDRIDLEVEKANAEVRGNMHQQSGQVITAQSGDGAYYIIGGDVATDEETGMPVLTGTGGAVVVKDALTGEVSVKSPQDVRITSMQSADDMFRYNEEVLRQQLEQQADEDITYGSPANEVYDFEDQVTLQDGNGGTIDGTVVMLPNAVDGVFVVETSDGKALQMTADELNRRIVMHNGQEVQRAAVTQQQTEQGNPLGNPRNNPEVSPNSPQNTPGVSDNTLGENEKTLKETEATPKEIQSALERIPIRRDSQGNPVKGKNGRPVLDWHKASVEDAAAALIETTGGDMVLARDTASDLVKNEQARLEKIRKQKPKGDDPIEIAESRVAIRKQEQEQQAIIKQWQDVNQAIQKQMRDEQNRLAAEREAAKNAEQKAREAEEARIRKEQQDEQARKNVDEYTELMKKEMEEKEAKYAAQQKDAKDKGGFDLSKAEDSEDDNDTRYRDDSIYATIESESIVMRNWDTVMAEARNARTVKNVKGTESYVERKTRQAIDAVTDMANRMHLDVEILTTTEGLTGKKARSKGWFNPKTHKIVIVLPNHTNKDDVINTLLHEGVAHYGLRNMFGQNFDTFLDNVYNNVSPEIKARIDAAMKRNGWSRHEATEEYLARLAEHTDFERATQSGWWQKIKEFFYEMLSRAGFDTMLTDNELRYILWRSYDHLIHPDGRRNVFDTAKDIQILSREEVDELVKKAGREPQKVQDGDILTQDIVDELNAEIKATKEADEMGLLYRDNDAWTDDVAQQMYEKAVAQEGIKVKEAWQDSMVALKLIQNAIAAETGRVATGAEDAYRFENRMHGRAKNMTEQYDWKYYRPMLKAFNDFCKANGLTQEQGMEYLISKSGLERNVYYAFRDGTKAKLADDIKREREQLEKSYARGRISEADYRTKLADLNIKEQNGVDDFMKDVRETYAYQHAKEEYDAGNIGYTEYLRIIETIIRDNLKRKTPKKDDQGHIVSDNYYDDYAKDYSGLTETFAKEMYDSAQKIRKEAQRAIDPQEKRRLWGEYDEAMRQAYQTARQIAEDAVFVSEEDRKPADELWKKINDATKETLRQSYESGLMDRNTYNKVRAMFDYYIPLRGWEEDKASDVYTYMGRDNVFSPAVKKAWGRTSKAENPLAYIGNIAVSTILSGHRNQMKQHFLNYVMNNPTSLVSISESWYENIAPEGEAPVWILRTADTAGKSPDEIATIVNDFNDEMQQKQRKGKAMPVKGRLRLDVHATNGQKAEHVVEVQRAGHTYQLYINGNPKAAQALNGSAARAVSRISDTWLGKKITKINRDMAMFFTSKNPAFVVSNLSRDLNMAGASVRVNENNAYNKKFIKNVAKVLAPRMGESSKWVPASKQPTGLMPSLMRKWQNGTLDLSNETERYFGEFMDEGGETGFVNMLSIDSFKEKMKKEIAEMNGSALFGKGVKETSVHKGLRLLGDTFEFYNRCAEDATRFIVYMTSRQMGKSLEESIADAKDVTLNFNRKGTGGLGNAEVRDLFIFVNPAIQALANMYRMLKGRPLRFGAVTAAFIAGGAIIPWINNWLLNMFGDDDDKQAYWNLPPWVRKNNLVFWIPFTKNFLTIPLAQEFRVFYGIGEVLSSMVQNHPIDKWGLEIFSSVADLVPINPTGNGGNLMVDFAPTMVQPLMQVGENVDFTGKPIWKENQGNRHAPMYEKAYVTTPQWMIKMSEKVNDLTGGNEGKKGVVEKYAPFWGDYINNPAVWNHLLQGYFGGMYNTIAKTFDVGVTAAKGELPKIYQTPVINRFLNRPVERDNAGALGEEYYNLTEERDAIQYELRTWQKKAADGEDGAQEHVDEILESPEYKRAEVVSHYETIMKDLKAGERSATESADKADIKESIGLYKQQMMEELKALDEGKDPLDAAIEAFNNARTFAEKNRLRMRIERLMMRQNGAAKPRTKGRAAEVEKALSYVSDIEKESRDTNEQYLQLASAEAVRDDARIKAAKAKVKAVNDEYKLLMADSPERAAQFYRQHERELHAYRILDEQSRVMNRNKKLLGKGSDQNIMHLIANSRRLMLNAIDNMK